MHTSLRLSRPVRPGTALAGLLLAVLCILPHSAGAQSPSFPGAGSDLSVNVRVYPLDLWSPRVGPGIGAGLVVHNLGRRYAQGLLTVAPALYEQVATLSWASANPRRTRRFVAVTARGRRTERLWFYGLGPASQDRSRVTLDQNALRAGLRVGQTFLDRRLLLRPHATLQFARVSSIRGDRAALRPRSRRHLRRLADGREPGTRQTGIRVGMGVQWDTRDAPQRPTRGALLQTVWDRYLPLDGTALSFDQVDLAAIGYVPLGGLHRLVLRGQIALTANRGEGPVPFYQLPTLDGSVVPGWRRSRFVGADRLMTSLLYRFPIFGFGSAAAVEGHLGVHAASVYDNLGPQFDPALSFDDEVRPGGSVPLRPAASAGLRFGVPMRGRTMVELAAGVSPEGLSGVRFTITQPLNSMQGRAHHTSRSLR